ncbi:MAG: aspartyl protease family protein, partial [Prevotellaceae bacterium]|nr:aspartyl protease family protein [Prevotellaceae bacterium]
MKLTPFILAILCSASLFAQRMVIPFERDSSSIVVHLQLNNSQRSLRFLFDTGADGMALRKSLADSLGIEPTRQNDVSF